MKISQLGPCMGAAILAVLALAFSTRASAQPPASGGVSNRATIIQRGDDGLARVEQNGARNQARTRQQGNGNRTVSVQCGQENELAVQVVGSGNLVELAQQGAHNRDTVKVTGDAIVRRHTREAPPRDEPAPPVVGDATPCPAPAERPAGRTRPTGNRAAITQTGSGNTATIIQH